MEYRGFEYVKKPVSRIIYGTQGIEEYNSDVKQRLDTCIEQGITTFDTARVYGMGKTEPVLGMWMEERENRENVVLISKCGHFNLANRKSRVNRREMLLDLRDSLAALRTDYIDIYLLHRDDPNGSVEEVVETLNEMQAKGKIRAFGGSNWTHERIAKANEYAYKNNLNPMTVSSPYCGLAEQVTDIWGGGCVSISGPEHRAAKAWYEENQMPVIGYSGLARGFFSGRVRSSAPELISSTMDPFSVEAYGTEDNFKRLARAEQLALEKKVSLPQIAIAWMLAQRMNTFAIVSASSPGKIRSNVAALSVHLTEKEARYLDLQTDSIS